MGLGLVLVSAGKDLVLPWLLWAFVFMHLGLISVFIIKSLGLVLIGVDVGLVLLVTMKDLGLMFILTIQGLGLILFYDGNCLDTFWCRLGWDLVLSWS